MKIVCKMTTVLACCQTRRGGGRKVEKRLAKQHNVCHAGREYEVFTGETNVIILRLLCFRIHVDAGV